jgi:hypothetical protein
MNPIEVCVRTFVDLLVRSEYETIERMTRGHRMSSGEIAAAVQEYGRRLVPPDEAAWWPLVEVLPVRSEPAQFHVVVPLWTEEEGRSDLSAELWLEELSPAVYAPTLLDVHVL